VVARRLTAAVIAAVSAVLAAVLLIGLVEGLDRDQERVTVALEMMLLYEAVGLAVLATLVFTIRRAVQVWRGEGVATMALAFFGALIGGALWLLLVAVANSS
jgi:hypothetical protein